jgi:hypothetical protein
MSRTLTADETRAYEDDSPDAAELRSRIYREAQDAGDTEIYSADGVMLEAVEPPDDWPGWDYMDRSKCPSCGAPMSERESSEFHTCAECRR